MPLVELVEAILGSPFTKAIGSAIISYSAHYGMAKAYSYACVPDGIYGFLQGMITSGSPVCQASVQVISATQVSYSQLILMGISRAALDYVAPGVPVK
jgi:hypothetical protein